MRRSEIAMMAFVMAVIFAGLFGPYAISIILSATAGIIYAKRRSMDRGAS